jgi:hypothetical protein
VNTIKQTVTAQPGVPVLKRTEILNVWVHKNTKKFYAEMKDGSLVKMPDRELKAWLL